MDLNCFFFWKTPPQTNLKTIKDKISVFKVFLLTFFSLISVFFKFFCCTSLYEDITVKLKKQVAQYG